MSASSTFTATDLPVERAPMRRKLGTAKGDFTVPDDFDAALADEVLREFET
jgi:hypothetical protein